MQKSVWSKILPMAAQVGKCVCPWGRELSKSEAQRRQNLTFEWPRFQITFRVDGSFGTKFVILTKKVISSTFELKGKPLR